MKKNKALLTLILGISTILCLTGCKNEDHGLNPENPVTISIWHYYNGAQKQTFDNMVENFNDTIGNEKGIIVQAYNQGNVSDLTNKVMDSLNHVVGADEMPDAFAAYADTAYAFHKLDMAADLSAYMTEKEQEEYVDSYMEEGKFDESSGFKLFPIAKSTEVLAVNMTDFDKFAVATGASDSDFSTWEGIVKMAKSYYEWTDSLTKTPNDGKTFFGRDAMANYLLIGSMQLGHEIFQVKDEIVSYDFDRDTMKRLWDNCYIPFINGYFGSFGKFRSDDVKTGDIIACVGSTSGITYFPNNVTLADGTNYDITSRIYPLPNFEGTKPYAVQQGAGMLVIKSNESKEYATALFLKWFTDVENNLAFSTSSGYLPVKKAANDPAALEKSLSETENISPLLKEALVTGMDITKNYQLYTNDAFEKGTNARAILNSTIEQKAKDDYETVQKALEKGVSREDALAPFLTEENFDSWYQSTKQQLSNVGE